MTPSKSLPIAILSFFLVAQAIADEPTSGDVVFFPGAIEPLSYDEAAQASSPLGWNIPGRHYRGGEGWWALACERQCTLTSTKLAVTPATHPDYDGPPLPSQFLRWTPLPYSLDLPSAVNGNGSPKPNTATLIALFKPLRGLAALPLKAGPVTTWLHAGMESYPNTGRPGTQEVLIDMGQGGKAVLVPRLKGEADLVFELRVDGKRQQLGAYAWHLDGPHPLEGKEYLQWAGDLDGDGKLDLLINFTEYYWDTALFLSSLAKPGELVGEAGRFSYSPPDSPGC